MNTPNYEAKIAGLLAKAEDAAATPAEAEAYSRKAERLMVKWGISEAVARAAKDGKAAPSEPVIERRVTVHSALHLGEVSIANDVARGLGTVRLLSSRSYQRDTSIVYLIGHEGDVDRAEMLFNSLRLQATAARRAWWRDAEERATATPRQRHVANRQFLISFGYAVGERLRRVRSDENRRAEVSTPGTELVLVGRRERVNAWLDEKYPKLGKTRSINGSGGSARSAGRSAGQRANLGGTAVGGTKGELR